VVSLKLLKIVILSSEDIDISKKDNIGTSSDYSRRATCDVFSVEDYMP